MVRRTPSGIVARRHGRHDPSGSDVVLVHGGADRAASFRNVVGHLGDLPVVVYDRRGYGESLDLAPARSLADHAADLLEVIGERPAAVVAHSFGGHVAVLAAITRPDLVRVLGLYEPPVPWMDFWPPQPRASLAAIVGDQDPGAVAERIYVAVSGRGGWERLTEDERQVRRREGAAFCADIASELDAPYDWDDLAVPVLFGHGSRTWPYSRDACAELAARLGQPEHEIDGATHVGHVTHPEGFAAFVRATVALGDRSPAPPTAVTGDPTG